MEDSTNLTRISLFEHRNDSKTSGEPYNVLAALMLNGNYMTDSWEISLSIFLWMILSYSVMYIGGACVAAVMMRRHPYMMAMVLPMLVMCIFGPVTIGAPTSTALAFALSAADKIVSPWHCMILGIFQSLVMVGVSFSRLLGTL